MESKMCDSHTVECYSTIKMEWNGDICYNIDELWENIMQSEQSQSEKTTYYMIPFIWGVYNKETTTGVYNMCLLQRQKVD